LDKSSLSGVAIALGGVLAGLLLEGGKISQILQPTAALIVFGGTLGAVMLQFPLPVVLTSFKSLVHVFFGPQGEPQQLIAQIVEFAHKARKEGIISLDRELENIPEPFLRKSVLLAVDGTEPQELRKMMELELDNKIEHSDRSPQVFEAAGGFAPTVGIIGAVLGLIQVMQHLDNMDEVGKGIAVAFVATIYGVASANLFFLPAAGKLRILNRADHQKCEMMLEGVISIMEGLNPRMVEIKLQGFLAPDAPEKPAEPPA
jgi:chemotaxis protein MotA